MINVEAEKVFYSKELEILNRKQSNNFSPIERTYLTEKIFLVETIVKLLTEIERLQEVGDGNRDTAVAG